MKQYLCRMLTDQSFPRIGLEFGGRDHSTVIHACDKIEEELKSMPYEKRKKLLLDYNFRKHTKYGLIIVIIMFVLITIFSSFKTIPTGYVGVKTQFGKVQDTMLNEGFNFKVPYIEKIINIDCRTQKCEYKDLQKISNIKIAINYNVDKSMANQLYKEVGTDFNSIIVEPAIFECVKQGMSQYTAEELITKRSEVSSIIIDLLTQRLSNKGILVTALNITDLSFSAEFDAVIEKKQITEQQTQQAKYELEKAKVENEKKIENAKAEAEVMKQQNSQITEQTLRLKELEIKEKLIEKWSGNFPTTMLNDNINALFNLGN